MPGLHKNLNQIFYNRCLIVLWICLWFWICQGFKYARVTHDSYTFIIYIWQGLEYDSSYPSVTQGSIETGPSYWIYIGCEYVKVTQGSV